MTTVKNFIQIIRRTILFLLGLALCGYLFYIRLIVVRVPREITLAWNKYLFIGAFLLVLLYGFLLIRILIQFVYTPKESEMAKDPTKLTWLQKGIKWVREAYEEALYLVYTRCIDKRKFIRIPLVKFFYFCMKKIHYYLWNPPFKFENFWVTLHMSLLFIPRIIVLIAFFIDVMIFHYFYYLYMCIILLIIPLAWRIFLYILKQRIDIHQKFISIFLIFEREADPTVLEKEYDTKEPIDICTPRELSEEICTKFDFHQTDEEYDSLIKDAQMFYIIQEHFIDILNEATTSSWYIRLQITVYLLSLNIWLQMLHKQLWAYHYHLIFNF